ncbi:hypothetical protein B0H12DRAFT_1243272 [Mycena haematopus]|nr:hypothetical protein B0H12DRAFT_1243272 [Mycena haematopus]
MSADSPQLPAQAPEVLLTAAQAMDMIRVLTDIKIAELARKRTSLGTADGPITDETIASIVAKTEVTFTSNKTWNLTWGGKPLEYSVLIDPRSTWAYGNSPGGNFGTVSWKTGDKVPDGISVEIQAAHGSDPCWTKTTRSRTDIMCSWRVQMWNPQFLNPRSAEYSISGRPIEWETSVEVHKCFDERWETFAKASKEVVKRGNKNGPTHSMFLSGRRPVFVPNASMQDEGRASEFDDTYNLKTFLVNTDLRFNRVPEVLVYDSSNKKYHAISFHQIHRLGTGLVMLATMIPTAYSWGAKPHQDKKGELQWEYRLVNLTIVGRRENSALLSPSKLILKRKALDLDLDSDEEPPTKKLPPSGSSASGSGSGSGPSKAPSGSKTA